MHHVTFGLAVAPHAGPQATMLHSLKSYIAGRHGAVKRISAVAGGLYIAKGYIQDRLEEVQYKHEEERTAREA